MLHCPALYDDNQVPPNLCFRLLTYTETFMQVIASHTPPAGQGTLLPAEGD